MEVVGDGGFVGNVGDDVGGDGAFDLIDACAEDFAEDGFVSFGEREEFDLISAGSGVNHEAVSAGEIFSDVILADSGLKFFEELEVGVDDLFGELGGAFWGFAIVEGGGPFLFDADVENGFSVLAADGFEAGADDEVDEFHAVFDEPFRFGEGIAFDGTDRFFKAIDTGFTNTEKIDDSDGGKRRRSALGHQQAQSEGKGTEKAARHCGGTFGRRNWLRLFFGERSDDGEGEFFALVGFDHQEDPEAEVGEENHQTEQAEEEAEQADDTDGDGP